jgi:glycosyltransferase involved in cell wall biosynthesis
VGAARDLIPMGAKSDRVRRRRSLWIFNHYAALPEEAFGTRHFDLARELVREGYAVTIFAASVNHLSGRDRLSGHQLLGKQTVGGVRFVWIRTPRHRRNANGRVINMLVYSSIAFLAQFREEPPDYIIGSSPHPFAGLTALIVAFLRRRPFFYEIRDLWPQTLVDIGAMSPRSIKVGLLRALERVLYDKSSKVISLLEGVPLYAQQHGLDPGKVVHIPNGVVVRRPNHPSPTAQFARLSKFRQEHSFLAVYVGSFGLANNVGVIVDAARLLREQGRRDIGLVLVGDGSDRVVVSEMVRRFDLQNVQMLDPIPKRDVPAFLQLADVTVLHFRRTAVHNYGISFNKLYDYTASGRPVVFACATPYDPIKTLGAGVSVEPDSAGCMASALVDLADVSPEARREMGERGRQHVSDHHNMAYLASRLALVLAHEERVSS